MATYSAQASTPLSEQANWISKINEIDPSLGQYVSKNLTDPRFLTQNSPQDYFALLEKIYNAAQTGDYAALQGLDLNFGENFEKYLDNRIAQQNTGQNQDWEEHMRDTSVTSTGNQLEGLGLSASGVLQSGLAAHSGVQTADNSMTNLSHQRALNKYNQNMALAKSLISLSGSLASSGIYGGALNAAKNASAAVATTTAHSGLQAMKAVARSASNSGHYRKNVFGNYPNNGKLGGFYSIFE